MNKKNANLLMVFMKNPVLGKVKTRLARTIGDEKALRIYKLLLNYTESIVSRLIICDKGIFYSHFIDDNDLFLDSQYQKHLQTGSDLGERISNAFREGFENNYQKVIIIGTDCFDLKTEIITEAFDALNENNVVIGPASDGGYYLIGMKSFHQVIFNNIPWSTENVLLDTINILKQMHLKYLLLPTLSDVDTEENLKEYYELNIK